MIGPDIYGSERGLERASAIQRHCLACVCIQLFKVTFLHSLIAFLSSFILATVCRVYPDAAASLTVTSQSVAGCYERNHIRTTAISICVPLLTGKVAVCQSWLWLQLSDEHGVSGR